MGCTLGHQLHRNQRTFRVHNVDKNGVARTVGRIEITDEDLILHQKGKDPICWPLRHLRRYGFDAELFSFESGRRCPTGQGIYAFKCQRAEALFNLLQECIQRAGQDDSGPVARATGSNVHPAEPAVNTRPVSQGLEPWAESPQAPYMNTNVHGNPLGGDQRLEDILNQHHQYVNTTAITNHNGHHSSSNGEVVLGAHTPDAPVAPTLHYAELDLPNNSSSTSTANNVYAQDDPATYVNIQTGENKIRTRGMVKPPMLVPAAHNHSDPAHSIGDSGENGLVQTDVNYIQVDIMNNGESVPASPAATQVTTSYQFPPAAVSPAGAESLPPIVGKEKEDKYAVIDFDKTNAINAKNVDNEGVRKTRHNSNLDDCV